VKQEEASNEHHERYRANGKNKVPPSLIVCTVAARLTRKRNVTRQEGRVTGVVWDETPGDYNGLDT